MPEIKKPTTLIYGVDDVPPLMITVLNGFQHVGLIAINLVYPLLIFRAVDLPAAEVANFLAIGMLVLGIATFPQARPIGPIGAGYMCPATFTATYFGPSLIAAKVGGLPLVFGMTIFAGLLEAAIAPVLQRLRAIFPPEISGLIIVMIGLSAGISGLRSVLGASAAPVSTAEATVGAVTLTAMVALNIWGWGIPRMLCALLGVGAGYVVAGLTGVIDAPQLEPVRQAAWIGVPAFTGIGWSFDLALAAPFAIACVAAAMKAGGTITVCQRINDANWVRPEMRSITGGIVADGLSTALAGVAGAVGTNTSTPSVGLSQATGVASRYVSYAVGLIFLLLAFLPKFTALFAVMPRSVILPALLFTVTFIIVNGLQILTSRLFDVRRTIVIGLSLVAGMAVEVFPTIAAGAPAWGAPVVGSSLVFATVVALALNLIFRIGVRQKAVLSLDGDGIEHQQVEDFFDKQTSAWGARPEIARRATFGVMQLVDVVVEEFRRDGPLTVEARFDEFNLDVTVTYRGERLEFPDRRPSLEAIESSEGARLLAGFMLRRNADRIRSDWNDGVSRVWFHFDH
jgi:xanthine permease XanP